MGLEIMKFKKGSNVEVFIDRKKDLRSGTWRAGRIVSRDGYYYDVRYELPLAATVKRVKRKYVRPVPPPHYSFRDWVPGDILEVFDTVYWRTATVVKVTGGDFYLIRLLGSSKAVRAHKSQVRVQQCWTGKGNTWIVFGKDLASSENWESDLRILQRSPNGFSNLEAHTRSGLKLQATEKATRLQRMAAKHPSLLPEKVDAVASSSYNQVYEIDTERVESNGDGRCLFERRLEYSEAESRATSVGSCSISSNSYRSLPYCPSTNPCHDSDSHCSDAESFCGWEYVRNAPLPLKEDVTTETHKLELHAYSCTMGALYCAGPLSWELEELVTNLRLMLHISNDEHLLVLNKLISGQTNPISS